MKKTRILWAMALLFGVTAMQAQSSKEIKAWNGLRLSYDHTFMATDGSILNGMDGMDGVSLGYVHAFKLSQKAPVFFEVGLGFNFAQGVGKYEEKEDEYKSLNKETLTTFGMSIPLNLVYGFRMNDNVVLKPYTGLYLKFNFMAKRNSYFEESYDGKVYDDSKVDKDYNLFDKEDVEDNYTRANICQVGWQAGFTLDVKKFNVGLGYALDFNEIAGGVECGTLAVRLGYNF